VTGPPPTDRHRQLRAIFAEAVLKETAERDIYLHDACAGDAELRAHVMRLLAVHDQPSSFLDQPVDAWLAGRDDAPFTGTDRFRLLRQVGSGGMGIVYEVHDTLRDEAVALKTLRRSGATDLYRLKREFRSLVDITHPNVVCLYELFVDAERSFFTMELVDGVSLIDFVRASPKRLVPALEQLIDGVSALHQRGKLHRDIKPSNVLVTPEGRVVILDFGILADLRSLHRGDEARGGTPAYLSPEEASGAAPSAASDWYGVGVTLYELLTGALPFDGSVADVLLRKRTTDPPAPADLHPDRVSADLSAICMGLLHRDPAQRLTGAAMRRALMPGAGASLAASVMATLDLPFVGRRRQLQALTEARDEVVAGQARAVAIYGPSGIGKSALARQFVRELDRDAVVLTGRCYEHESVPYKALDGVVDDLSRYLASSPPDDVCDLLPRDVSALARVFPVLLQVGAIAGAARGADLDRADPFRIRRLAFEALNALLARLAARTLLVIWIDDLQWADADSIVLLDELLAPTNSPAMLTLLSFRQEEIGAKPFLQALLPRAAAVSLEPMTDDEADALISGVVVDSGAALTNDDRRRMTHDAGGSPFVLEQLALYAGMTSAGTRHAPTFDGLFESRVAALSSAGRLFLETLATCGRPVAPDIVCDASGVARDRQSLVMMLRAARFIRSSGSSDRVETYHDRIRAVLTDRLRPDRVRDIHTRMAASMVARQSDDCDALFEHYRGAGDGDRASIQAGLAAEKAGAALAFDRSASFYQHALDLAPSAAPAYAWREGLAAALANAGRPAEAAHAYLRAAEGATRAQHIELQRRAAEQFLIGGHIDRGLDLSRQVLESVGLTLAPSPRAAAVRLVWRRARLRFRGTAFVSRSEQDEIDGETLMRLDTCWATATGLALVDVISASDFAAQHLHLALDAGEPSRIARGLALEAAARSADWVYRKSAPALAARAKAMAERLGTPHARAIERLCDSVTATATGQWRRALVSSGQAMSILRDECVGVTWELNIAQNMHLWGLMYLGELAEVCRRVPVLLADARRRANLYLATEVCTRSNLVWLVADQPDEGEREVMAAIATWSQKGFHRQHYSAMLARVQTALYRGDNVAAWRILTEQEPHFRRSMLRHVQAFRVEDLYLRGRSALAIASANRSEHRFLAIARDAARRIDRERMHWSTPLARLLQGGIASVEGNEPLAVQCLEDALDQFERAEMQWYAAVTRRRLGALGGADRGHELFAQATAWMAGQGIKNPIRITRMLAPGFPPE
jgi:eukaryotic-like serine/threonine-protein kinase